MLFSTNSLLVCYRRDLCGLAGLSCCQRSKGVTMSSPSHCYRFLSGLSDLVNGLLTVSTHQLLTFIFVMSASSLLPFFFFVGLSQLTLMLSFLHSSSSLARSVWWSKRWSVWHFSSDIIWSFLLGIHSLVGKSLIMRISFIPMMLGRIVVLFNSFLAIFGLSLKRCIVCGHRLLWHLVFMSFVLNSVASSLHDIVSLCSSRIVDPSLHCPSEANDFYNDGFISVVIMSLS